MYDVAPVPATAAPEEIRERGESVLTVKRAPSAHAPREFLHDRSDDKSPERVGEHGRERRRTGEERGQRAGRRRHDGCGELTLERRTRRYRAMGAAVPTPIRKRSASVEAGTSTRSKYGCADGKLVARDRLRDERVERAEEHGQRGAAMKRTFWNRKMASRDSGAPIGPESRRRPDRQRSRPIEHEDRDEIAEQQRPDRREAEGMNAVDDSASRKECPEDREGERRDHEREVPGAKEAALLFDHHRVQVVDVSHGMIAAFSTGSQP